MNNRILKSCKPDNKVIHRKTLYWPDSKPAETIKWVWNIYGKISLAEDGIYYRDYKECYHKCFFSQLEKS